MWLFNLVLLIAFLGLAVESRANIVLLGATKDNTLFEDAQGSSSNGAGEFMFAGSTLSDGLRRALIAFDIAGAVPAGATITNVQLVLNMSKSATGNQNIHLHRVVANWGEGTSNSSSRGGGQGTSATTGDATWLHTFFNSVFWSSPGGDFDPAVSATVSVGGLDSYTWGSTSTMVADVQSWLDTPTENFGWILIGNEANVKTAKRFGTKENVVSEHQPQLIVEFDPATTVTSRTWDGIKRLYQ